MNEINSELLLCFCNKRERERERERERIREKVKANDIFFPFCFFFPFPPFFFDTPLVEFLIHLYQRNSKHHTHLRTMSDHEVETFESTDAGASKTIPMQAGSVRKGGYIVIKGKACKVRASSIIFSHLCRKMKRIRARPSSRERIVGRFTRVLNALPRVLLFSSFCGGV